VYHRLAPGWRLPLAAGQPGARGWFWVDVAIFGPTAQELEENALQSHPAYEFADVVIDKTSVDLVAAQD